MRPLSRTDTERRHAMSAQRVSSSRASTLQPALLYEIRRALADDTPDEVHDLLEKALNDMLGDKHAVGLGARDVSELRLAFYAGLGDLIHDLAQEFAQEIAECARLEAEDCGES